MKRILGLLIIGIGITSCKKEKTIWESEWSSPLINDTLTLDKLVDDSTFINTGGFYSLDLDRTLINISVKDLVSIEDTTIAKPFTVSLNLTLAPGTNFVNSVEENLLNIDNVQLKTVILEEGFIDVQVENPLPTTTIFLFELPGVVRDGLTFSKIYEAPPSANGVDGVVNETIDLSGYEIDLSGISGGDHNLLRSQVTVSTDPLGPEVSITPADITNVEATFRDVKLQYARGYFGNKTISDTTEVFIEALSSVSSGSIDIPATTIQFHIENGIKVNGQASFLTVNNTNNDNSTVALTGSNIGTNFNIDAATGSWATLTPSQKVIEFNATNSNIEGYIENLGREHSIGYSMQMNPWGNVSGSWDEIFPQSELSIRMTATMPLQIGLDNLILRDTFAISLNQDPDKTRIISGELILQASNAFPISGDIILHMLDENGVVLNSIIGSSTLKSSLDGMYNDSYGFPIADSELRFILSQAAVSNANDVKSLVVQTRFNSINPMTGLVEQQSIPFGAFLGIKLKTKFITENNF